MSIALSSCLLPNPVNECASFVRKKPLCAVPHARVPVKVCCKAKDVKVKELASSVPTCILGVFQLFVASIWARLRMLHRDAASACPVLICGNDVMDCLKVRSTLCRVQCVLSMRHGAFNGWLVPLSFLPPSLSSCRPRRNATSYLGPLREPSCASRRLGCHSWHLPSTRTHQLLGTAPVSGTVRDCCVSTGRG